MKFQLPPVIGELLSARNHLRDHYGHAGLTFTLDGNLVGDLGEALAAELFGVRLTGRNATGIDGYAPDGRSVQVKASGCGRGAAFRMVDITAQHLLFFSLDFDRREGIVDFNGPEEVVRNCLPEFWRGQRSVSRSTLLKVNEGVKDDDRLPFRASTVAAAEASSFRRSAA